LGCPLPLALAVTVNLRSSIGSNVDDIVEKYLESVIQPAIDQLEKLGFYQDDLNMLDLQCNRRHDEGIKRFGASLANSLIGYYWKVHTELPPEILWIGDHMERLKTNLAAINYNTTDLHALVAEVIAPEVVTHLIAHDLGIEYDEALEILRNETAWNYGGMIDNTNFSTEGGFVCICSCWALIRPATVICLYFCLV
jgi:hypothetical protein